MTTVAEAIATLDRLLDEGEALLQAYRSPLFGKRRELWSKRAEVKLREWGLTEEAGRFRNARGNASTAMRRINSRVQSTLPEQNVPTWMPRAPRVWHGVVSTCMWSFRGHEQSLDAYEASLSLPR